MDELKLIVEVNKSLFDAHIIFNNPLLRTKNIDIVSGSPLHNDMVTHFNVFMSIV